MVGSVGHESSARDRLRRDDGRWKKGNKEMRVGLWEVRLTMLHNLMIGARRLAVSLIVHLVAALVPA